jgi:hypothetical protein
MLTCYICGAQKPSVSLFKNHITHHSVEFELVRPIRCCQNACRSTFLHTYNFFRHIERFHRPDETLNAETATLRNGTNQNSSTCMLSSASTQQHCSQVHAEDVGQVSSQADWLTNMRNEGIALIASLRANSSIPYTVISQIVDSVNKICENLLDACHYESVQSFETLSKTSTSDSEAFASNVTLNLAKYGQPLNFLNSTYKQDSFFNKREFFVAPESVNFGLRFERSHGRKKQCMIHFSIC